MTDFAPLVPELLVRDLAASRRFYCDLLGFQVLYERPEDGFVYLEIAGAQIMLEQFEEGEDYWITGPMTPPFGRGINFEIGVPLLEPLLHGLRSADWPLFRPPEERWYRRDEVQVGQRQFLVQDPDGYLLRFAEDLGERPASAEG